MIKHLLGFAVALSIGVSAFAGINPGLMSYVADTSTTGGKTITCNVSAVSGRRIVVYNLVGRSDLSTSVISIGEATTAGTPSAYTVKTRLDVGAATRQYAANDAPFFVGRPGYAYQFLLNSTTANSLFLVYQYE